METGEDVENKGPVNLRWKNLEEKLRSLENEQDKTPKELVSKLSPEEKTLLIIESFRISAGSYPAHALAVAYIGLLIGLDSENTHEFLIETYKSLEAEHQIKIIQAMPMNEYHLSPLLESVPINEQSKKPNDEDKILFQLEIIKNNFDNIFASQMKALKHIKKMAEDHKGFNSKRALMDVCAYLRYYDKLNWYKKLPPEKQKNMCSSGLIIVQQAISKPFDQTQIT